MLAHHAPAQTTSIDLRSLWDTQTPLANPHKGWYQHFYEQGLFSGYAPKQDGDLTTFPGMDHLYLRIPWRDLQPAPGEFRWEVIDDVVRKWVPRGYGIAFRVTTKDTSFPYATPEWVKNTGAKGEMVAAPWGETAWQPDYGDPVFLKHLERFHQAFAARYDGKPWVDYIDIGTYGDWGEGHNSASNRRRWPLSVVQRHIDLYLRYYKRSRLVVSDDMVSEGVADADRKALEDSIVRNGITFRDDSIGVGWYYQHNLATHTVRSPELFERVWRKSPTVLELQHYPMMKDPKRDATWEGPDGSIKGAAYLEGAIRLMRATYVGHHGDAAEWLRDNPNLTRRLLNQMGYWYFPQRIEVPTRVQPGHPAKLSVTWLNRGVAPAYHRYPLSVKLVGRRRTVVLPVVNADNRTWMPSQPKRETYQIRLPKSLPAGDYEVRIGLEADVRGHKRPVELGLNRALRDKVGCYRLATVKVVR
jgi:hypothetical protein